MFTRLLSPAAVTAFAVASSVVAAQSGVPGERTFDNPLDGVWVGTMQATSATGTYDYPLLLNLDATATVANGLALLPDDLFGNPTVFAFAPLAATVKGSRLAAEVPGTGVEPVGDLPPIEPLRFDLRLRRGRLTGKVRGAGLKPGNVDLVAVAAATPLQHVWLEEQPTTRASGPLALAIFQGDEVGGLGLIGPEFGPITAATLAGDRLEATLSLPSGDVALALTLANGTLRGTITGSTPEAVSLFPGGVVRPPNVSGIDPTVLATGRETTLALRGRDLYAGYLVHFDYPGVLAQPPVVTPPPETAGTTAGDGPRNATMLVSVDSAVDAGVDLIPFVVGMDNVPRDLGMTLRTETAAPVSFTGDLLPVFAARCATSGCHVTQSPDPEYGTTSPPGNLILEATSAYGNLVNRPSVERTDLNRVTPGDPDASYLIMKLRGAPGIVGDRMPYGGPYLSEATIAMFVEWVRDGAPRN